LKLMRNPKKARDGRAIFGIIMGGIGSVCLIVGLISFIVNLPMGALKPEHWK